jgi:hypothetical protein
MKSPEAPTQQLTSLRALFIPANLLFKFRESKKCSTILIIAIFERNIKIWLGSAFSSSLCCKNNPLATKNKKKSFQI